MGQVQTNNIGLASGREPSLGANPTVWTRQEPNTVSNYGSTVTTVARRPISPNRQARKGTVTDLDSSVEFDADLTVSGVADFIEGFLFATGINRDVTQLVAVSVATNDYTLAAALVAAQIPKFITSAAGSSLIWVSGFVNAANNGLHAIDVNAVLGTDLSVSSTLVDETGASARISFAGYRVAAATAITWTYSGVQGTLAATGLGTTLTALGLVPGQFVHFGSVAALVANPTVQNDWGGNSGYARVVSISADAIVFDKVSTALQSSQADPGVLDIVFGGYIRNVGVGDPDFLSQSYQFELSLPNLGDGTPGNTDDAYEYALGNFANTMAVNVPLTDKATVTFGFVGTDTETPTTTRKAGASAATEPTLGAALNTSSDVARLRFADSDESSLATFFKSLTINVNNNVSPEKVIGRLGALFLNTGNFDVTIEGQALFDSPNPIARIRENATVSFDFVVSNDDGVVVFDVPSMTLGGGDREYPVNETVRINMTGTADGDNFLGISVGISLIPVPIPAAESD